MHKAALFLFLLFGLAATAFADAQPPDAGAAKPARRLPPFIKPLPADAPKPTDDLRDLRGMWMQLDKRPEQLRDVDGAPPPYAAEAEKSERLHRDAAHSGKPIANQAVMCRPPGALWNLGISYFPVRILQNERQIVFLFERFHMVWRIALNQRHPDTLQPSYLGHSVGHWENGTLVVDTIGLRQGLWLDESGSRLSDAAHLVSRITKRPQSAELEILTTIDDPRNYAKPWTLRQVLAWRPDYVALGEHDCEEGAGSVEDARRYGYTVEE